MQSQLNKTHKFSKRPGVGNLAIEASPPNNFVTPGSKIEGHNYTVSINFNRPQQSKGIRPKQERRTKNAWAKGYDSPNQKVKNDPDLYNYDIKDNDNFQGGFIDIESSTRKRPSKTANGKKRSIASLRNKVHNNKNKRSFHDSGKFAKPISLENTENLEGVNFHQFIAESNEAEQEMVSSGFLTFVEFQVSDDNGAVPQFIGVRLLEFVC